MIWIFWLCVLLHLAVCVAMFVLIHMRIVHISYVLLPVVLFVPPVGFILALSVHFRAGRKAKKLSETEMERLTVDNELYKSIDYQQSGNETSVVPVQEALLLDDAATKRALMLDVLNQNTSNYVPLLKKAREDSDTEVSHYAITAMVELQKEYDIELQQISQKYQAHPQDIEVLNEYMRSLHSYLQLGLLDGTTLAMQRNLYLQLIDAHEALCGAQLTTSKERFDIEIALKNYSAAELTANAICTAWPQASEGYMARLQLCAEISDGAGVRAVLAEIKQKHIYVNAADRETMGFWSHETEI